MEGALGRTAPTAQGYSTGLASLRGLAACVVVFYHALLVFRVGGYDEPHRMPLDLADPDLAVLHGLLGLFNGANAVILFFVLSGTVLTLSLERAEPLSGRVLTSYYVRRAFRILPLLAFVALVAAAAHSLIGDHGELAAGTSWMAAYYSHSPNIFEVAANVIGWSNSLNSPTWTIRVEILASLFFPLLFVWRCNPLVIGLTTIGLALFAFAKLPEIKLNVYLIAFYLGALVPLVGDRLKGVVARVPAFVLLAVIAGAIGLAAGVDRLYKPWVHQEAVRVLLIAPCAAILVGLVYAGFGRSFLARRVFVFLGDISYSIYLIHFGIIFALAYLFAPLLPRTLSPWEALTANVLLGVLALLVTIPVAAFTYNALERPAQEIGRRLSKRLTGRARSAYSATAHRPRPSPQG